MGGRGLGALRFAPGRPFAAFAAPNRRSSYACGSLRVLDAHYYYKTRWAEEDSNLQGLPHELLRLARLPISPSAPMSTRLTRLKGASSRPCELIPRGAGPGAETGLLHSHNLRIPQQICAPRRDRRLPLASSGRSLQVGHSRR